MLQTPKLELSKLKEVSRNHMKDHNLRNSLWKNHSKYDQVRKISNYFGRYNEQDQYMQCIKVKSYMSGIQMDNQSKQINLLCNKYLQVKKQCTFLDENKGYLKSKLNMKQNLCRKSMLMSMADKCDWHHNRNLEVECWCNIH